MPADLIFQTVLRRGDELVERGRRLAGGLQRLGLREGGVIAVLLRNDPVYADIIYACRTAGLHYCPLNWHFTPDEIAYIVNDCGARAMIGHADLLAAAQSVLRQDVPVLAIGKGTAFADYETWLNGEAPYEGPVVVPRGHLGYTSGTTGRPKGVRRLAPKFEDMPARQAAIAQIAGVGFGIVPNCRLLLSAPLYHSAPAVMAQHALLVADRLVIAPRFDAQETLALIERHRIDVAYLTPTMLVRLLRLPEDIRKRHDLSSLRFIASTGAPCAPEVKRAAIEWLGPIVNETYASTETGLITIASSADSLAKPGTAGRPLGEAVIRIYDADGRLCKPGEVGSIYACQPAYPDFTYHNKPESRRAIERDGLVCIGDMGYVDEDGYLFICDRASDMVISGGVNIYPAEIEHAILSLHGIIDCAVFGIPDPEYGERLHAVVQTTGDVELEPSQIIADLRRVIAGYKIPRTIEIVAALPRDDNGKIAKRRLREAYWQGESRRI